MAVDVIPTIPKRTYDFSDGGATVVVERALDVTAASSGSLLVRVHEAQFDGSGGSVKVVAKVSAPSREQPEADFVGPEVASVTIEGTPEVPLLLKEDLDPEFGGFLWIEVVGTQGSGATTMATISVDLAMKV
jgi:hypothetical protein